MNLLTKAGTMHRGLGCDPGCLQRKKQNKKMDLILTISYSVLLFLIELGGKCEAVVERRPGWFGS